MQSPLNINDYLLTQVVNGYININNEALNSFLKKELNWESDAQFLSLEQIRSETFNLANLAKNFSNEYGIYFKENQKVNINKTKIDANKSILLACNYDEESIVLDYRPQDNNEKLSTFNEPSILGSYFDNKLGQRYRKISENPIEFFTNFRLGSPNTFTCKLNNKLFELIDEDNSISKRVIELLDKGADINTINMDGHNILTFLLSKWDSTIHIYNKIEKEFDRQLKVIIQLINLGVNVNHITVFDNCFKYVYYSRNYKLIAPLIEAGADLSFKNLESGSSIFDDVKSDLFLANYSNNIEKSYLECICQEMKS